jgi:hypothetical protein
MKLLRERYEAFPYRGSGFGKAACILPAKDHPDGESKGTVTDEDEIPVPAATVYTVPQGI